MAITVVLDGKQMTTKDLAHEHIKTACGFPDYYGKNLDALWDMLSECAFDIIMENTDYLLAGLEDYGFLLLDTLKEASDEFENISFRIRVAS